MFGKFFTKYAWPLLTLMFFLYGMEVGWVITSRSETSSPTVPESMTLAPELVMEYQKQTTNPTKNYPGILFTTKTEKKDTSSQPTHFSVVEMSKGFSIVYVNGEQFLLYKGSRNDIMLPLFSSENSL